MNMKEKFVIRHGVFESNSSSSHAISINTNTKDSLYDTIFPDSDGIIRLTGGQFDWSEDSYNDALTKANYAAIFATENISDRAKTITEILDDFILNKNLQMLKDVIIEQTGANDVLFEINTDWDSPNTSYIDHQSNNTAAAVFESKEILKSYIFNRKSVLYTSNDNGGVKWNLNTGEILDTESEDDMTEYSPDNGVIWVHASEK